MCPDRAPPCRSQCILVTVIQKSMNICEKFDLSQSTSQTIPYLGRRGGREETAVSSSESSMSEPKAGDMCWALRFAPRERVGEEAQFSHTRVPRIPGSSGFAAGAVPDTWDSLPGLAAARGESPAMKHAWWPSSAMKFWNEKR